MGSVRHFEIYNGVLTLLQTTAFTCPSTISNTKYLTVIVVYVSEQIIADKIYIWLDIPALLTATVGSQGAVTVTWGRNHDHAAINDTSQRGPTRAYAQKKKKKKKRETSWTMRNKIIAETRGERASTLRQNNRDRARQLDPKSATVYRLKAPPTNSTERFHQSGQQTTRMLSYLHSCLESPSRVQHFSGIHSASA